mmetsp:Transcript_55244/g.120353  ORF Transcript_55244/g.120353 Transcript_55244/m.120353 type:complete len:144 (+) Transcript_55244:261-692(+)
MPQHSVTLLALLALLAPAFGAQLTPCSGDTRGDGRCNHDSTHRVCANIGSSATSFFKFSGQRNWCGTRDGSAARCPPEAPTWCICKWATARWIEGEGCNSSVNFDCAATDVCNLKRSFSDGGVNLQAAHDCVKRKCPNQWDAC